MIPQPPFPQGPRLHLRPLIAHDARGPYREWINDPRVRRFLATRFDHLTEPDIVNYLRQIECSPDELMLAVCRNGCGRHVGNVKLQQIDLTHRSASLSIVLGDPDTWGRGFGSESISLLVHYAFSQLLLDRVSAGCFSANVGAVKSFLKCGFKTEGHSRGLYLVDGRRCDVTRLGLLRSDKKTWHRIIMTNEKKHESLAVVQTDDE